MKDNEDLFNEIEGLELQVAEPEEDLVAQGRQTVGAEDTIADVELELDEAEESVVKVDSAKDLISDFYFGRGSLYNDMLLEVNHIDSTKHKQKKQYIAGFTDAVDALSKELN